MGFGFKVMARVKKKTSNILIFLLVLPLFLLLTMVFQATTLPVLSQLLGWAGEITWGWCGELDGSGAGRSDSQPHTCSRTAGNSAH